MSEKVDFDRIRQFIFSEIGLTYYKDRENELRRKIDKALKQSNVLDYNQYLRLLRHDKVAGSKAFDDLVSELTIGETHFFRDEAVFGGLKDHILPLVIQKNQQTKRLWIWSAGCATGEEAYTIAILLQTHFAHLISDWDVGSPERTSTVCFCIAPFRVYTPTGHSAEHRRRSKGIVSSHAGETGASGRNTNNMSTFNIITW